MKRFSLYALALFASLVMDAQTTYVGMVQSMPFYWIPKDLTIDNHIYFFSHDYSVEDGNNFHIYNENLETVRDINVITPSYTYTLKIEEKDPITGEWRTVSEETKNTRAMLTNRIKYTNYDTETSHNSDLGITQSLFSDDEKFEFYIPVPDPSSVDVYEYDSDGDNVNDRRETTIGGNTKYINVISEDGDVIATVTPPDGYTISPPSYIAKMGGKFYLICWTRNGTEGGYGFYRIEKGNSSIQHIFTIPIKVLPTVASPSDMITVEFGDNPNVHEITVVNAAGQTVKQVPVENGQRSVSFSAQSLGRGLNILNAPSDGKNNACKIIIK